MTKSELIEILAQRHNQLAPKDAELAVKTMLDAMSITLAQGDRIEIRGFGSFGLNYRPPRTGRNPKTGEKVLVPKKYVPHFKAGKELRERVDEAMEAADAARRAAEAAAQQAAGGLPSSAAPLQRTGTSND
jgi:integration host factor subunit beta